MIKITLNGEKQELEQISTIKAFLADQDYGNKLVAIAINGQFVPKSEHDTYMIAADDDIEIVAPMQGG